MKERYTPHPQYEVIPPQVREHYRNDQFTQRVVDQAYDWVVQWDSPDYPLRHACEQSFWERAVPYTESQLQVATHMLQERLAPPEGQTQSMQHE